MFTPFSLEMPCFTFSLLLTLDRSLLPVSNGVDLIVPGVGVCASVLTAAEMNSRVVAYMGYACLKVQKGSLPTFSLTRK